MPDYQGICPSNFRAKSGTDSVICLQGEGLYPPPSLKSEWPLPLMRNTVPEPSRQLAGGSRQQSVLGCLGKFAGFTPDLVLVKEDFGAQLDPFCVHTVPAEEVTNWIICSFKHVAEGKAWTISDIGLCQSLSQWAQNIHAKCPASENIGA